MPDTFWRVVLFSASAATKSRAISLHFLHLLIISSCRQVRDAEVQGCSSPHPTHCIKRSHLPPAARCHILGCPHTSRGPQVKQVADSYSVFLEPVMCRESIYRGRREKRCMDRCPAGILGFFRCSCLTCGEINKSLD